MARREKIEKSEAEIYRDKVESRRASSKAVSTVNKVGSKIGSLFTNPVKRSGSRGGNFNLFVFFIAVLLLANFSRILVRGYYSDDNFLTFSGLLETVQEVPNVFDTNYSDLGLRITQDWGSFWNTLRDNLNTMGMVIQTLWTFILLLYQLAVFMSSIVEGVFGLEIMQIFPVG